MPEADLLDEYVRRTAARDPIAFHALYDLLSPYVQDSAACLFGYGDEADNITTAVFIDVWHLAHRYKSGAEGARAWVLNVAGQHTMRRYQPTTGSRAGGDNAGYDEFLRQKLDALLAAPRITALDGD